MNDFELTYRPTWNSHFLEIVFDDEDGETQEISMSIESRHYKKGEDGKNDYTKRPTVYIDQKYMNMITEVLRDMVLNDSRKFDDTDLICELTDKLSEHNKLKTFRTIFEDVLDSDQQDDFFKREFRKRKLDEIL